jgi:hypothetical protein
MTTQDKNKSKQSSTQALAKQGTQAIVDYGGWDLEQAGEEAKEMSTGGDFWKAPVGKTAVRFLPPKKGWPSPFVIMHQHFIRMPGVERPIVFCCPKQHESKRCIACEKADELETSGSRIDVQQARNLRPSKRVMANCVVDPKNAQAEVVIWGFGVKVFNQLLSIRKDEENGGDFTNPAEGFNVVVERKGTGKDDTEYTCIPGRNRGPIANQDWLTNQKDLRKLIKIPTPEQARRLLDGEDPRDVWSEESRPRGGVIDVDPKQRTAEDDVFDDDIDLD